MWRLRAIRIRARISVEETGVVTVELVPWSPRLTCIDQNPGIPPPEQGIKYIFRQELFTLPEHQAKNIHNSNYKTRINYRIKK